MNGSEGVQGEGETKADPKSDQVAVVAAAVVGALALQFALQPSQTHAIEVAGASDMQPAANATGTVFLAQAAQAAVGQEPAGSQLQLIVAEGPAASAGTADGPQPAGNAQLVLVDGGLDPSSVPAKTVQSAATDAKALSDDVAAASPLPAPMSAIQAATAGATDATASGTLGQTLPPQPDSPAIVPPASWEATTRRALSDLALLSKNQAVLDRQTTDPASQPDSSPSEPARDFFQVQTIDAGKSSEAARTAQLQTPQIAFSGSPVQASSSASAAAAAAQAEAVPTVAVGQAPKTANAGKTDDGIDAATSSGAKPGGILEPQVQAAGKTAGGDGSQSGKDERTGSGANDAPQSKSGETSSTVAVPTLRAAGPTTVATAPESTDTQGRPLTATETGQVIRQIVDRAEALAAAKPRDGVVVHLEPKDLGSITLVVKSVGNQVDAQIGASNEHVRAALEQNRGQLGQALEARGLNLNSVKFDDQTTGSTYAQTQQQTQQQNARQAQGRPAATMQDEDMPTPDLETIHRSVRKAEGVDIWT